MPCIDGRLENLDRLATWLHAMYVAGRQRSKALIELPIQAKPLMTTLGSRPFSVIHVDSQAKPSRMFCLPASVPSPKVLENEKRKGR
jgi:hypothetical protein